MLKLTAAYRAVPPNTAIAVQVLPPLFAFKTTLPPVQKVVGPAGVMVAAGKSFTVTEPEAALTHLPVAVAVAVITSPPATAGTVAVQAFALTVVVPIRVLPAL